MTYLYKKIFYGLKKVSFFKKKNLIKNKLKKRFRFRKLRRRFKKNFYFSFLKKNVLNFVLRSRFNFLLFKKRRFLKKLKLNVIRYSFRKFLRKSLLKKRVVVFYRRRRKKFFFSYFNRLNFLIKNKKKLKYYLDLLEIKEREASQNENRGYRRQNLKNVFLHLEDKASLTKLRGHFPYNYYYGSVITGKKMRPKFIFNGNYYFCEKNNNYLKQGLFFPNFYKRKYIYNKINYKTVYKLGFKYFNEERKSVFFSFGFESMVEFPVSVLHPILLKIKYFYDDDIEKYIVEYKSGSAKKLEWIENFLLRSGKSMLENINLIYLNKFDNFPFFKRYMYPAVSIYRILLDEGISFEKNIFINFFLNNKKFNFLLFKKKLGFFVSYFRFKKLIDLDTYNKNLFSFQYRKKKFYLSNFYAYIVFLNVSVPRFLPKRWYKYHGFRVVFPKRNNPLYKSGDVGVAMRRLFKKFFKRDFYKNVYFKKRCFWVRPKIFNFLTYRKYDIKIQLLLYMKFSKFLLKNVRLKKDFRLKDFKLKFSVFSFYLFIFYFFKNKMLKLLQLMLAFYFNLGIFEKKGLPNLKIYYGHNNWINNLAEFKSFFFFNNLTLALLKDFNHLFFYYFDGLSENFYDIEKRGFVSFSIFFFKFFFIRDLFFLSSRYKNRNKVSYYIALYFYKYIYIYGKIFSYSFFLNKIEFLEKYKIKFFFRKKLYIRYYIRFNRVLKKFKRFLKKKIRKIAKIKLFEMYKRRKIKRLKRLIVRSDYKFKHRIFKVKPFTRFSFNNFYY